MNYRDEEDIFEEDIVFDQAGLLSSARKRSKSAIRRVSSGRCAMLSKTLALCGAFFGLGLSIALPGPATPMPPTDLDTENGGEEYLYRCLGFMLGSMLGGMLLDRFNRLFLVFLALLMCAILVAMVPWTGITWLLRSDLILLGATMGFLLTGGNVLCLDLWGQNSGPFMQALHFSFSLGAFLAPLIATPLSPAISTVPPITEHHRIPRDINNDTLGHAEGFFVSPIQPENLTAMSTVPISSILPLKTTNHPLLSSQTAIAIVNSSSNVLSVNTSTTQDISSTSTSTTTMPHSTRRTPKPKPEKNSGKNLDQAGTWDKVHAGTPDPKDVLPIPTTKVTPAPLSSSTQALASSKVSTTVEVGNATIANSSTTTTTTSLPIQEIFQKEPILSKENITFDKVNEKANANLSEAKEGNEKIGNISSPVTTVNQSGQETSVGSTSSDGPISSSTSTSGGPVSSSTSTPGDPISSSTSTSGGPISSSTSTSGGPISSSTSTSGGPISSSTSTFGGPISNSTSTTPSVTTPSSSKPPQPDLATSTSSTPSTAEFSYKTKSTTVTSSTLSSSTTSSSTTTSSTAISSTTSTSTAPTTVYSPEAPPKLLTLTEKKPSTSEPAVATPRLSTKATTPTPSSPMTPSTKLPSFDHVEVTPRRHHSKPTSYDNDTEEIHTVMDEVADHFGKEYGLSRLQLSYLLVALLLFVVSLLFLGFLCFNPRDPRSRSEDDVGGGRSNVIRPRWIRIMLTTLMMFVLAMSAGVQFTYGQLLVLFAMRSPLALSLSTGTALTATYWGAATSTRLACILLASALSPGALLVISVALTAAATWLLSALAVQSEAALWVGAVLVAVGTASIPPSSFLWMQHHVHVSHHVAGMLVMGPAMGEMLFPPLALRIVKSVGPAGLLHLPALLSLAVIALWAAAWRLARHPCSSLCAHADPAAHSYQLASQTDEDDVLDLAMSPVTHRGSASVARRASSHANGNGVHRSNT